MLYLYASRYFVPPASVTVDEAAAALGLPPVVARVYQKIYGLKHIPRASDLSLLQLLRQPAENILLIPGIEKIKIRYLIHCHTAKVNAPFGESVVRELKATLQLPNAQAFGVALNNCASSLATLDLLSTLLLENETALIVCGDIAFTPVLQVIPNTSLLGDGAAAILVGKKPGAHCLRATHLHTLGQFAAGIWQDAATAQAFEKIYAPTLAETILTALDKAAVPLAAIRWIVPHNVNRPSWQRVAKALPIEMEKIYLANIERYSHCFGADIFINHACLDVAHCFMPGDYYVLATVGLGAVFAAAVFQYIGEAQ